MFGVRPSIVLHGFGVFMLSFLFPARSLRGIACSVLALLMLPRMTAAHDFRIGAIVIDHPYATTGAADAPAGFVYFKAIRNRGDVPDRLVGAHSPIAARVVMHQTQGPARKTSEVAAIELAARAELRMRHGASDRYHLRLEGLKAPLRDGEHFDLTLRFEKAGERTIPVGVTTPRGAAHHTH